MNTEHHVTYLRVREHAQGSTPSAHFLERLPCGGRGPVMVQRWLLDAPLPLPPAPAERGGGAVEEAWVTDLNGLEHVLATGGDADVGRLVVRLAWPLTPMDEATLLQARVRHPGLRLAVPLPPSAAEEVFYHLDCLGLPWLALPEPEGAIDEWVAAMRRLLRLWLFEPRSCTPMEPTLSAFRIFCLSLRAPVRWRLQVVDCQRTGPAAVSPWLLWTPALHTALVAGGSAGIDPAADDWAHDLPRLCADLDRETLVALAPAMLSSPKAYPRRFRHAAATAIPNGSPTPIPLVANH